MAGPIPDALIHLRGVSKTFNRGQPGEVVALRSIDLLIEKGTFTVLIGGNGSGKSTLFNIIAGAIRPSAGQVWIAGRDVTPLPEYQRSAWIARVFQNPLAGTASSLSILDNFRLAALRTRSKGLRIGIDRAFRERVRDHVATLHLGLENKLDQVMGTLSGGQRQALTLLMCVMDHTDILLLDEPTAALDPKSAAIVLDTAHQLISHHNLTAVMITHNLADALAMGDRLIHMQGGVITHDVQGDEKTGLDIRQVQHWFSTI